MRILNEINKISNKIMGPNGYYIVQGDGRPPHMQGSVAPGPGPYAPPHAPQHSYTYPPPNGYGPPPPGAYGSASPMPPAPVHSPMPPSPMPGAPLYAGAPQQPPAPGPPQFQQPPQPQPQASWPPPHVPAPGGPQAGPAYGPQPPHASPQLFTSPPQQFISPPQQYTSGPPTSPPQVFTSPPQQLTSPPLPPTVPQAQAPHSYPTAPLPPTTAPYPFGPPSATPQLSPSMSSHASSPQTPQLHNPHVPPGTHPPAYELKPHPAPEDWVTSLHALLPTTLQAASEYVDGASIGIDTFWLYFVDLGGGAYFADAAYGIDGQAFKKDDLGFAGVSSTPDKAHALYKVLAGEWVTRICMRSQVEEMHPARVVVRYDVASQGFVSTACYEVSAVKHPSLAPALVFKEWVARLKATGDDSAHFVLDSSV